jgi:hypothetical protein
VRRGGLGGEVAGGLPGYEGLRVYHGDLHGHCEVGYGRGCVWDAYQNARLLLDFASVTAHGYWHDIPRDESCLEGVVAYHQQGFERAARSWSVLQDATEAAHCECVTFLSFEWHPMRHGDHSVYFKGAKGDIIPANGLEEMRAHLSRLAGQGWARTGGI